MARILFRCPIHGSAVMEADPEVQMQCATCHLKLEQTEISETAQVVVVDNGIFHQNSFWGSDDA